MESPPAWLTNVLNRASCLHLALNKQDFLLNPRHDYYFDTNFELNRCLILEKAKYNYLDSMIINTPYSTIIIPRISEPNSDSKA